MSPDIPPSSSGLDAPPPRGVASETIDEVRSPARRSWLGLTLAACGAALALQTEAHALAHSDQEALRFLLELEDFQHEFFDFAIRSAAAYGLDMRQRDVIYLVTEQDREHREWARLALEKYKLSPTTSVNRSTTSPSRWQPRYSFPAEPFRTAPALFNLTIEIKELGVGAYHDLVARVDRPELIQALAALGGIEGRHAAALRQVSGSNALPSAFEKNVNVNTVSRRLARFGFRGDSLL